ncbi:hypothetical protein ABB07_00700 [Streptomyces incarnatus]|uniref:Uncharacterized protein n=1 Tax=Streptomyces incarnatus TaxID=665007 RepID=A0ABN4GB96_9ACTN|nr:hypothetical protein ABB07_00700 [Streptomyces incarnatus]
MRSQHRAVVFRLVAALHTGRIQGLLEVMAPCMALIAAGDGGTTAVRAPGGRTSGAEADRTASRGTTTDDDPDLQPLRST